MEVLSTPICAESYDTCQQYRKLYIFSMFRGRHYKIKFLLAHILFLMVIPIAIVLFHLELLSTVLFWAAVFVVLLYMLFLANIKSVPEKNYLKIATPRDSFCKYIFNNTGFSVIAGRARQGKKTTDHSYADIHIVYELGDCFYIFMDENNALIIEKNMLTSGTTIDLSRFIAHKIGAQKYIIIN